MTFNRSTEVLDFTGRTLEGKAYRYDYPSRVSDTGWQDPGYYEEMMKGCDTRSLNNRASFPLVKTHSSQGGKSVGEVSFRHSDDEKALMFIAHVDRSAEGDQVLEDIEEWKDVSVTFDAIRSTNRSTPYHGKIVGRQEVRLTELALAPNGTGLNKGAEITVVRSAMPQTDSLEVVRRKLILL